jgi:hypothetical protein
MLTGSFTVGLTGFAPKRAKQKTPAMQKDVMIRIDAALSAKKASISRTEG